MICFTVAVLEKFSIATDLLIIHALDKDVLPTPPSDLKESISYLALLVDFS